MLANLVVENDESGLELKSLSRWLNSDPDVQERITLTHKSDSNLPGEMGLGLDLIEAVFNGVVDLSSLALAIVNWRETRPSGVSVRIKSGNYSAVVDGADDQDIQRLTRLLNMAQEDTGADEQQD
ncbi:effector-associated constant component EACC1 [Kitasatospora sp. DSM 101779]|uniref:effector-associated constant component EACC1 n=1 Tax=Kitasatospora sp. DSM 101779 TaxID=2853165 RepID=UPI0021D9496B|nr:hypothetical protein [Kitasatospora sp. DSM 101779]MCU7822186.1 hypothetical protein [Kitasatospora sp. DSM 101779]